MNNYVTTEHFDRTIAEIRAEFADFRNENATIQDKMMNILLRLDQERIFMVEWVRRIESDVTLVKKHLKLA